MPKWSQIPWGTVITGAVAVYGAALSTFNFIRTGPKLRFTVRTGMVLAASEDERTFIQIEVSNHGDRATTLRTIDLRYFENPRSWARLLDHATKAAVLNDPNPRQPFPHELKPGSVWGGLTVQEQELVK